MEISFSEGGIRNFFFFGGGDFFTEGDLRSDFNDSNFFQS